MACDMFSMPKAKALLNGKNLCFFGGSNVRAIYKDLLWLLENGTLIPESRLKSKNELSHANDERLSQGVVHSGRSYQEDRVYRENPFISFNFITRLHTSNFVKAIKDLNRIPDAIILSSCVWDLTRWGSNGVAEFKTNLVKTFQLLKQEFPSTCIIWLTTLPITFRARGGFFTKEIEFTRNMLPWHIMFANKYASDTAKTFGIDVIDLHYHFRFLLNYHARDGIHWNPTAMRHIVNMLLTHLALVWNCSLPGMFGLDARILEQSYVYIGQNNSTNNNNKRSSDGVSSNLSRPINNFKNISRNNENSLKVAPESSSNSCTTNRNKQNRRNRRNRKIAKRRRQRNSTSNNNKSSSDGVSSNLSRSINNFKNISRNNENSLKVALKSSSNSCTTNCNKQNRRNRKIAKRRRQNRMSMIDHFRRYFY